MAEKTLWSGGRLNTALDQAMSELNQSLSVDQRMASQDVQGSLAWAQAIHDAGILNDTELADIQSGLRTIGAEFDAGTFPFEPYDEDIHSAVERRLTNLVGAVGGKLHTGRSRNDQVVTDFRLWLRDEIELLLPQLKTLQQAFLDRAKTDMGIFVSGYTHFQQAQPILLSHWWLSHLWALERDVQRLNELKQRLNVSPLGCGALAGTAFPVDRFSLAQALGFDSPAPNSLDAVSDRDFVCDFLYWAAMLGMHLSRCAEAMILYSTMEFGYLSLSDAFSTGSSLMPQKKNPDSLELVRGKSASLTGKLTAMLTALKGLPSAYDKDLQEDKTLVFAAADSVSLVVAVMSGVLNTLTVNRERCESAINPMSMATDAADYLVKKGMPFREAHHAVGKAVKAAETACVPLSDLPLADWQAISSLFDADISGIFSLQHAVDQRNAWGGTAHAQVQKQIELAEKTIQAIS